MIRIRIKGLFLASIGCITAGAFGAAPPTIDCPLRAQKIRLHALQHELVESPAPVFGAHSAEIQKFALYNYRNLIEDFSRSKGPYIDALLSIAGVEEVCREEFIAVAREVLQKTHSKSDFANAIAAH